MTFLTVARCFFVPLFIEKRTKYNLLAFNPDSFYRLQPLRTPITIPLDVPQRTLMLQCDVVVSACMESGHIEHVSGKVLNEILGGAPNSFQRIYEF
jgi:hypothetical protein